MTSGKAVSAGFVHFFTKRAALRRKLYRKEGYSLGKRSLILLLYGLLDIVGSVLLYGFCKKRDFFGERRFRPE